MEANSMLIVAWYFIRGWKLFSNFFSRTSKNQVGDKKFNFWDCNWRKSSFLSSWFQCCLLINKCVLGSVKAEVWIMPQRLLEGSVNVGLLSSLKSLKPIPFFAPFPRIPVLTYFQFLHLLHFKFQSAWQTTILLPCLACSVDHCSGSQV